MSDYKNGILYGMEGSVWSSSHDRSLVRIVANGKGEYFAVIYQGNLMAAIPLFDNYVRRPLLDKSDLGTLASGEITRRMTNRFPEIPVQHWVECIDKLPKGASVAKKT